MNIVQAWRPYRKKDIDKIERIQRRATKIIPELRDLSYIHYHYTYKFNLEIPTNIYNAISVKLLDRLS